MKEKISYIKNQTKNAFKEFKIGTKTMFKEFFNKETNKKQRANMWTFLRLIVPLPIIICSSGAIILSSNIFYLITALLVGFGALTDYFDGASARKHKSSSNYGKLLDQISDKVFAGIIGINLLLINPVYLVILLGELIISGINVGFKLKNNELCITSSKIGKIKQWPLFISLGLGFLSPINTTLLTVANISVILTSLFQLLTTQSYINSNQKEIKNLINKNNIKINLEELNNNEVKEKELVKKLDNKSTSTKIEELKDFKNSLTDNTMITYEENKNQYFQKTKTL